MTTKKAHLRYWRNHLHEQGRFDRRDKGGKEQLEFALLSIGNLFWFISRRISRMGNPFYS